MNILKLYTLFYKHNIKNFTTHITIHNLTHLYKTQQNSTTLLQHFTITQLHKTLHNSARLRKTIRNDQHFTEKTTSQHITQLYTI